MKRLTFILLILSGISGLSCGSDVDPAGKVFLLPSGARSLGMGGCGTLLGESYGGLYNPAAQALTSDLSGAVYLNPSPYFISGFDFLTLAAGAHTEFGYIGFSYLSRDGVAGSNLPPEEASSLVLAGRPVKERNFAVGVAMKILASRKANFVSLNQSLSKSYKMAFDLGAVYAGILPQITFGKSEPEENDPRAKYGRPFPRGIAVGLAFQNLGGRINYDYAIDVEMLPQLFRADLLWGIYEGRLWDLRVAGQLNKLLVARNAAGGYKSATDAFTSACGGGSDEGGWTSRMGLELSVLSLASARLGWSVLYGEHCSYTHAGLGLGPEWLRANIAWEHQPGSDYRLSRELRYDLTVNVSYERVRGWTKQY